VAAWTALTCTSLLVQHTLGTWRLRSISDQVEAVALQLVRGAIEATGSTDENLTLNQVEQLSIIAVGLRQTEDAVVIEVWDSSQEPPSGPAAVGYHSGYFMLGDGKVHGRIRGSSLIKQPERQRNHDEERCSATGRPYSAGDAHSSGSE